MSNSDLIRNFYESFSKGNVEGMVSCYAADVIFTDPAFGELRGTDAKNMWRMLIENSKGNLKITFSNVKASGKTGSADWRAEYVFSQTGRKAINIISAEFEFQGDKIIKHTDHFSLWCWARQALGWKGYLLGWTPFMKTQIQKQAKGLLKKYNSRQKI
jgi:ketosteroid isomerase-like protein